MKDNEEHYWDWVDRLLATGIIISVVTLLFALFPALWRWLVFVVDVRNWSRLTWLLVNLLVVVVLIGIRVMPELKEALTNTRAEAARRKKREERKRRATERQERISRRVPRV